MSTRIYNKRGIVAGIAKVSRAYHVLGIALEINVHQVKSHRHQSSKTISYRQETYHFDGKPAICQSMRSWRINGDLRTRHLVPQINPR